MLVQTEKQALKCMRGKRCYTECNATWRPGWLQRVFQMTAQKRNHLSNMDEILLLVGTRRHHLCKFW